MNKISPAAILTVGATLITVFATFDAAPSHAATLSDAQARYQKDRANCMAGKSVEDQKTCLKEAGAALQAARQHDLASGDPALWAANERKRCEPLSGDDKKDCLKRVAGLDTTVSGSVASGGDLKETITVVPGTPEVHPETMPPTAAGPATPPPQQPGN